MDSDLKELGMLAQLPEPDCIPQDAMNPRAEELKQYREVFFDPALDGFSNELEYVGKLPYLTSREVESSPLGCGFEVLDHRCGYDFEKVIPIMRNSGIKWARLQSGWQRAETVPGVYDFGWLDNIVDKLLDAGITPWFSLSFGNPLYMKGAAPLPPHNNYFFSPTAFGEEGIRGWENYCRAMAKHFKGRVDHFEIWNEPNAGFLRKANLGKKIVAEEPAEYAKLVKISAHALHEIQPEAQIIAGSISGCAICNEYISKLFKAGIADDIDIFSYHPYSAFPEFWWPDRLQFIRDEIAKTGKKIKIWQGENGRPSDSIIQNRGFKSTEGSQARYLTRRYITDLKLKLDMTSYFLCCDIGNGYLPNGALHAQGVISAKDPENYRPKLAFRAMQSMAYLFRRPTEAVNGVFEIRRDRPGSTTEVVEHFSGISCCFRRGSIPIFAYYHVTNIDADWTPVSVNIHTWVDETYQWKNPVLIDPITARIYRIRKRADWCDGNYGKLIVFQRMPLLDYPLFMTDAAIIEKTGASESFMGKR